ncbi:MAG: hypothetical protein K6G73_05570 [Marinilabiliaceae bacterium]|nr:hypothetical protein [Marinilabiliaceae bacterium]
MMEEKIKHLEFVQSIITRMNTCSFQLKGWMITIVSALLALFASSSNELYIYIAIVPTLIFWFLDTYYLQQERKFRGLYNDIVLGNIGNFEMPIDNYVYAPKNKSSNKYRYGKVFMSKTLWPLYGIIAIGLLITGIVLTINNVNCL